MSPKRVSMGLLPCLGLAAIIASCQKKEQAAASPPPAPAPTAAAAPAAAPAAAAGPTMAPAAAPPAAPAAAPAASPAVLASADGEKPGRKVEVTEFKRLSGGTVSLKFTMINDSDDGFAFHGDYGEKDHPKDWGSIGGTSLVDPVGKKKYLVLRDSDGNCLCSRDIPNLDRQSRMSLWVKFPAPPGDVKKVSIVIPHYGPMDDVPISE